ncbi:MAG: helix-turn-helix transcriptional regulator [Pseudomonadota bacterium]
MNNLVASTAGFSLVAGWLLWGAYAAAPGFPKKTTYAVVAGALLTAVLSYLQIRHLTFVLSDADPFTDPLYRQALFAGPLGFLAFGRAVVLPNRRLTVGHAIHLLPLGLPWILPLSLGLPLVLALGLGYAGWLSLLVLRARATRRQRRFEAVFSALVVLSAAFVLGASLLAPWSDPTLFVAIYSCAVAGAYALVTAALVAIPDFVRELFEEAQIKYAESKLRDVDVDQCMARLERLMVEDKLYRDESLSLSSAADCLSLSPHQLSELLNKHMDQSFPQYLKAKRLAEASERLRSEPNTNILTIALDAGFRSQSTFYTAFKNSFGVAPGDYRAEATAPQAQAQTQTQTQKPNR